MKRVGEKMTEFRRTKKYRGGKRSLESFYVYIIYIYTHNLLLSKRKKNRINSENKHEARLSHMADHSKLQNRK